MAPSIGTLIEKTELLTKFILTLRSYEIFEFRKFKKLFRNVLKLIFFIRFSRYVVQYDIVSI